MYIVEKSKCSGCAACALVCPKQCITMKEDKEGFLYPEVDEDICIGCKLCQKACQPQIPIVSTNIPKTFACINKDELVREKSSSGGVFTLLAEKIIKDGGEVCGAAFDDEFNVHHIFIDNLDDIKKLQGSKYVQSRIESCYSEAKQKLESGKKILFTGTPCQLDGLFHYLGDKVYDNLYTQDILCHGVVSPKVWRMYFKKRIAGKKSAVKNVSFRNKKYGWKSFSLNIEYEDGSSYTSPLFDDKYLSGFLKNLYLRPSCYNCSSKTRNRNADISLADFWGIESEIPEFFDNKGTSLVLVNTKKGEQMLDLISDNLKIAEIDAQKALSHNSAVDTSSGRNPKRDEFFADIDNVDIDKLIGRYVKKSFKQSVIDKVRLFITPDMLLKIKKIIRR